VKVVVVVYCRCSVLRLVGFAVICWRGWMFPWYSEDIYCCCRVILSCSCGCCYYWSRSGVGWAVGYLIFLIYFHSCHWIDCIESLQIFCLFFFPIVNSEVGYRFVVIWWWILRDWGWGVHKVLVFGKWFMLWCDFWGWGWAFLWWWSGVHESSEVLVYLEIIWVFFRRSGIMMYARRYLNNFWVWLLLVLWALLKRLRIDFAGGEYCLYLFCDIFISILMGLHMAYLT